MTRSSVIDGNDGSSPISFSATITWAELEIGSSSAKPWIMARIMTCTSVMPRFYSKLGVGPYKGLLPSGARRGWPGVLFYVWSVAETLAAHVSA